jgi:hypothetical protein
MPFKLDIPIIKLKAQAAVPCPEGLNPVLWAIFNERWVLPDIRELLSSNALKDM